MADPDGSDANGSGANRPDADRIAAQSSGRSARGVPGTALRAPVWVIEDPRPGTAAQALGIAERIGVPFRRLPIDWTWRAHIAGLSRAGSLSGVAAGSAVPRGVVSPRLVLSAGRRSAAVALWLKARHGCRIVHCMSPGLAGLLRRDRFDLLVLPGHDLPSGSSAAANVFPTLGAPNRMSPERLRMAHEVWVERLDHLPRPRVALLVGGPTGGQSGGQFGGQWGAKFVGQFGGGGMDPAAAHALGRAIAGLTIAAGGSVMATTSRRTGKDATEALAAGLGRVMHLIHRWGEPGQNPYDGFLALADVIVVTGDSASMLSEACATGAAVYVVANPQAGARHRRMLRDFAAAGQARPFAGSLAGYSRQPLDEAGRVAGEIVRRFGVPGGAR